MSVIRQLDRVRRLPAATVVPAEAQALVCYRA